MKITNLISPFLRTFLFLGLSTSLSFAVPNLINYQGRLTDGGGIPVSANVTVSVAIFPASVGGVATFTENTGVIPVVNGLYSFEFGDNPSLGTLATALAQPEAWLEVTVDGDPLTPRQRLIAAPYTIHAQSADSLTGGVDDADPDPNNERISSVNLNGNSLEITEGGILRSVDLASVADNDSWSYLNGSGVSGHLRRSGNVTVGSFQPVADESIRLWAQNYESGKGAVKGVNTNGGSTYSEGSLGVLNFPATLNLPVDVRNIGVYGFGHNVGQNKAAIYGWNTDDNSESYGGVFVANGTALNNYAVYGLAENGTNNYAGYFDGDVAIVGGDDLYMNNGNILQLGSPNTDSDATNKLYVDSLVDDVTDNLLTNRIPYFNGTQLRNSQFYRTSTALMGLRQPNPLANLHLKQSVSTADGNGGIMLENASDTDNWKIYHSGSHLSFAEIGIRRAYIAASTGAYTQISDRRAKQDIEELPPMLEKVKRLRPSRYRYKQQADNSPHSLGLIAQEVKEVLPEIVSESEDGMLGIQYGTLSVVALKALQEQQDEIDSLRKELAEIKELLKKR